MHYFLPLASSMRRCGRLPDGRCSTGFVSHLNSNYFRDLLPLIPDSTIFLAGSLHCCNRQIRTRCQNSSVIDAQRNIKRFIFGNGFRKFILRRGWRSATAIDSGWSSIRATDHKRSEIRYRRHRNLPASIASPPPAFSPHHTTSCHQR